MLFSVYLSPSIEWLSLDVALVILLLKGSFTEETCFSLTWSKFGSLFVSFLTSVSSLYPSECIISIFLWCSALTDGFPDGSVSKESACNAVHPSSISWSGRSTGKGICYPLQDSWASLVAQLVKKPPAMWETWVRSLGWEDPPEKGKAIHSSILAWRIPWIVESMESHRVRHDWVTFIFTCTNWSLCFLILHNHFSFILRFVSYSQILPLTSPPSTTP